MTREEKLQKAHQMFDNRNLLTELKWQREYFKRGYISNQEELFNLWIFDECIKALEQEPTTKNDLGVDCISRKVALDACHNFAIGVLDDYYEKCLKQWIIDLPSVTPQESILDKIRAEIEQLPTQTRINWDGCCPDIDYPEIEYIDVTKKRLLHIIDKYKAESEG